MRRTQYQYRARALLSHRDTGAYTRPGDVADLTHLSPDEIQTLVDQGAVAREVVPEPEPVTRPVPAPRVRPEPAPRPPATHEEGE